MTKHSDIVRGARRHCYRPLPQTAGEFWRGFGQVAFRKTADQPQARRTARRSKAPPIRSHRGRQDRARRAHRAAPHRAKRPKRWCSRQEYRSSGTAVQPAEASAFSANQPAISPMISGTGNIDQKGAPRKAGTQSQRAAARLTPWRSIAPSPPPTKDQHISHCSTVDFLHRSARFGVILAGSLYRRLCGCVQPAAPSWSARHAIPRSIRARQAARARCAEAAPHRSSKPMPATAYA